MAGVNKVIIIGHLGQDPEVRYAQSGTAICTMSVAVTERRKEGDTWKDATEWFRVVTFGKTAENAGQHLAKGRQVYVEGRLQTSKYKAKDGTEKTLVEVVAHSVVFLGGGGGQGGSRAPTPSKGKAAPTAAHTDDGFIDDSLPF